MTKLLTSILVVVGLSVVGCASDTDEETQETETSETEQALQRQGGCSMSQIRSSQSWCRERGFTRGIHSCTLWENGGYTFYCA
jgi:hypothetical protein